MAAPGAVWQYKVASTKDSAKGEGHWNDFPADASGSVEKAFQAGALEAKFVVAGKPYTIKLSEMKQYSDTDASRVRLVRRLDPSIDLKRSHSAMESPVTKTLTGAPAPVAWQYKGAKQWHNFAEALSAQVDSAFKSGETAIKLNSGDGEYVVDFRKMQQHPALDPGRTRLVRRIGSSDKIADALTSASAAPPDGAPIGCEKIPMRWDHMDTDYKEIELVGCPKHNVELLAVIECFEGDKLDLSKTVVSVKRIQNVRLWRMYADQRELVKGKEINAGKANEHFLWHGSGTSSSGTGASETIKRSGFEGQFSQYYPFGTWLSTNSQFSASCHYAEACSDSENFKVFLVRTTLGYIGRDDGTGRRTEKVGTEFADSHHCGGTSKGHERKDDQIGGGYDNRYVVYNDHQLYPAYVVEFK